MLMICSCARSLLTQGHTSSQSDINSGADWIAQSIELQWYDCDKASTTLCKPTYIATKWGHIETACTKCIMLHVILIF